MDDRQEVIAAFDFDGTLTYRDNLIPFFIYCRGWIRFLWALVTRLPILMRYLCGYATRGEVKSSFLSQLFGGLPADKVRRWGASFADGLSSDKFRPGALERLEWHREQGHTVVLISANLDLFLEHWAKAHHLDALICTRAEVDKEGRITGKLIGENCWGVEKRRRLEQFLKAHHDYLLHVYGDSKGDHDILMMAEYPYYNVF